MRKYWAVAFPNVTGENFPGGPGVEKLPANAGVTGSIPGLGRFHTPRSHEAWELQLLMPML